MAGDPDNQTLLGSCPRYVGIEHRQVVGGSVEIRGAVDVLSPESDVSDTATGSDVDDESLPARACKV